jgi:hypothetical protein
MPVFTVSSGGVPAGSYTGTFAGTEIQPENKEKGYSVGTRWKFTIDAGPYAGQTTSRITGSTASSKNSCGKMLAGLLGRALKEGEQIDPEQFVGKRFMIVVAAGQGGGTRVEAVVPMPSA